MDRVNKDKCQHDLEKVNSLVKYDFYKCKKRGCNYRVAKLKKKQEVKKMKLAIPAIVFVGILAMELFVILGGWG